MAGHRRLLIGSIVAAVIISIVGGWLLSRGDDSSTDVAAVDDIVLERPGTSQIPSIGTNAPVQGTSLPTVDLTTNDGGTVVTADLLGQPLVINVWNSTCGPCKKELPAFAAVHAQYGDRVRFVGVNTLDVPEVNESFARERGVQYELLRDVDGAFTDAVGIATQPVTLFVATDGTIVRQTGVLDEATLQQYVDELLA
ncbi:MAG: TlpA disulfide reductase family protein [Actinomycetota bacterium]|jgi:thiol-disulfide isomerase/thioredoxin